MSVQATTAVWEHSEARGPDLVTMLAIADAANAEGRNAYPGMDRLSRYTRRKKRAVLASIARCLEAGELEKAGEGHRGAFAVYDVALPGLAAHDEKGAGGDTLARDERVQSSDRKGAVQDTKGAGSRHALLLENQEPKNGARARDQHPFEDFWSLYPKRSGRRLGKAEAERQWARLAEAERFRAMTAVRVYAGACGRGETLAKDAFRWLRDRSFLEWADLAAGPGDPRVQAKPPPECAHGFSIKARCEECEAEGIPQDQREAV